MRTLYGNVCFCGNTLAFFLMHRLWAMLRIRHWHLDDQKRKAMKKQPSTNRFVLYLFFFCFASCGCVLYESDRDRYFVRMTGWRTRRTRKKMKERYDGSHLAFKSMLVLWYLWKCMCVIFCLLLFLSGMFLLPPVKSSMKELMHWSCSMQPQQTVNVITVLHRCLTVERNRWNENKAGCFHKASSSKVDKICLCLSVKPWESCSLTCSIWFCYDFVI